MHAGSRGFTMLPILIVLAEDLGMPRADPSLMMARRIQVGPCLQFSLTKLTSATNLRHLEFICLSDVMQFITRVSSHEG
jgi:hypothetical protein